MSLIDLQRRAVELCCAREAGDEQLQALGDERIWRLYRELIRNRLRGELKVALKRTYAAAGAQAFERAFEHHMQTDPPRSRFFHGVVSDFVQSAVPFFRADPSLPSHLGDLAEYEGALWAVSDLPDAAPEISTEFAFDRRAVLSPALRLLALQYAVHRNPQKSGAYERISVYLCLHRRPEEKTAKRWELNAVSFDLMQRLQQDEAPVVSEAVQQVAAARSIPVDEKFLDRLCTVLATFIDGGIILGAR